ncbi:hypothetical protein P152DRAFT_459276 [Eremomyces bilateralis CBS 781.70]|uniref:Uncharacterized protein n=1 Tax=Eremomyces bilateralis CBS 781.70 TaxID=1392243 RepID=A0A6G1G1J9_9PEZI|nr:uncharacterized protein P152DRAFT_459276 [Eremomyces bilateralis CBS 781.70]KAF1811800.1 hypothetical protein P152DRAFT_459276 [Eremomyces bilateralis CBS 781.70]
MDQPVFVPEQGMFVTSQEAVVLREKIDGIWKEPYEVAQELQKRISKAQGRLKKTNPQIALRTEKFTWRNVHNQIDELQSIYEEERMQGTGGFVRRGLNKIGKNASTFEKWLKLVPQNESYAAPITGAFQVVLSMGRRMHEVRREIFDALVEIPELFEGIDRWIKLYGQLDDDLLMKTASNLCAEILRVLCEIVSHFGESHGKKFMQVTFKIDSYERRLSYHVEDMRKAHGRFKNAIEACSGKLLGATYDISYLTNSRIAQISERQEHLIQITMQTMQLLQDPEKLSEESRRNVVLSAFHRQLCENAVDSSREKENVQEPEKSRSMGKEKNMKRIKLAHIPEFDPEVGHRHIKLCRHNSEVTQDDDMERLGWVKRSEMFRSFLIDRRSGYLLIEGNMRDDRVCHQSSLSLLIAEMAELLEIVRPTVFVTHFCGLHAQEPGCFRDIRDLLIEFIGQLLMKWDTGAFGKPLVEGDLKSKLESRDHDVLVQVFITLLSKVPKPWTIFLFIDAIDMYETPERLNDTMVVIRELLDLVETEARRKKSRTIKLLVTAPASTIEVGNEFEAREGQSRLMVPDALDESMMDDVGLVDMVHSVGLG